jgi:hypothetical protein
MNLRSFAWKWALFGPHVFRGSAHGTRPVKVTRSRSPGTRRSRGSPAGADSVAFATIRAGRASVAHATIRGRGGTGIADAPASGAFTDQPGRGSSSHLLRVHRRASLRLILASAPAPPSSILHLPRETRPHVCVIPLGSSSGWGRAGAGRWALGFSESGSSAAERELEQSGRANMCERTRK